MAGQHTVQTALIPWGTNKVKRDPHRNLFYYIFQQMCPFWFLRSGSRPRPRRRRISLKSPLPLHAAFTHHSRLAEESSERGPFVESTSAAYTRPPGEIISGGFVKSLIKCSALHALPTNHLPPTRTRARMNEYNNNNGAPLEP